MVFFIIAVVVLILGVALIAAAQKDLRRRKRILDTPTSPIAQAPGSGLVEIKGRVLPGDQGLVRTPFSERNVVWFRITVEELRSSGKSSTWVKVLSETDCKTFYVEDGSGQTARVVPSGANVILDKQDVARSGTFRDAPPQLEAFLQQRGLKSTSWLGFNKSMRYEEETLSPGDPVYALGRAKREPGPPVQTDGYRTTPTTRLLLEHGIGEEEELILTNKTEEQLISRLRTGFITGVVLAAIGGVLSLVAAATLFG
jgi:hypothetical protein